MQARVRHSDAAYSPYAIQQTARPPSEAALLLCKTQSVALMTEAHPGAMLWLHRQPWEGADSGLGSFLRAT